MDDVYKGCRCRILAMDEDVSTLEHIRDALHSYGGYEVTICDNQTQALHLLLHEEVEMDIVIAAINEARDVGLMFIDIVKRMTKLPVLAISSDWSGGLLYRAVATGVFFILEKPIRDSDLHWVFVEFPRWLFPRRKEEEARLAKEIKDSFLAKDEHKRV